MSDQIKLATAVSLPSDFRFDEVRPAIRLTAAAAAAPSLGPLGAFVGNWGGNGFNTIFRPDNSVDTNRAARTRSAVTTSLN